MNNLTVDGTEYDLMQSAANGNVTVEKLKGRTGTKVTVAAGSSSAIKFANGAALTVNAEKTAYTTIFDGKAPTKLELGSETNLTKTVEGTKTIVKYQPKVTKTNFLGEVTFNYVTPKAENELTEADKAKTTALALTSPEGTSKVTAVVNYNYGKADLTFDGTVNSITVDGKTVDELPVLERITKTPIIDKDTGEQKKDENGELLFKETAKATTAVINFADGVTFTLAFDEIGNFTMSDSGMAEKDLQTESKLDTNGDTGKTGPIDFKNTTAKTYARNNTDAGVLNITIGSIKNDRLPEEPTPPTPPVPENPKGKIEITKVDMESGKTLPGAEFEIWSAKKENGKWVKDKVIFTGTTGADGKLTVDHLDYAVYFYHETKAPDGYKVDGEYYKVEVNAGHAVVKVTMDNSRITGNFELIKVDQETGKHLSGAVFEILNADKKVIYTGTTGEDGKLTVKNLTPGKYYFREVSAPSGYLLDKTLYEFTITKDKDGQTVTVKFKNEEKVGHVDVETPDKPDDGDDDNVTITTDVPQTGDTSNLIAYILLTLAVLAGTFLTARVQNTRKNKK